jgi:hypothetical protein
MKIRNTQVSIEKDQNFINNIFSELHPEWLF